ncbi:MAG: hypothetical protein D4R67_01955 [Bacteroidetes bacterium]|nr:MAG: hypothetical protein D4R67_01955 [Bacteroidota bacterium]
MNRNHNPDLDLIERYLEGNLDEEESNAFRKQMQDDPELTELVKLRKELPDHWKRAGQYQQVRQEVRGSLQVPAHRGVFQLNRTVWTIAASVIILLGTALLVILTNPSGPGGGQMAEETDSLLLPSVERADDKALLEEVNPEGSGDMNHVELIGPEQNATFREGDPIVFNWETNRKGSIELTIFEVTSGRIILARTVDPSSHADTLQPQTLEPGRYFWYLGDKSQKRSFTVINP